MRLEEIANGAAKTMTVPPSTAADTDRTNRQTRRLLVGVRMVLIVQLSGRVPYAVPREWHKKNAFINGQRDGSVALPPQTEIPAFRGHFPNGLRT